MVDYKIGILGWGSLLWDDKNQHAASFTQQHGDWNMDGPVLKLEFSRKSDSRNGALTLVIDAQHGSECTVAWTVSARKDLGQAIDDLMRREGTVRGKIKSVTVAATATTQEEESIRAWAKDKRLDCVIWTGLESNFVDFSLEAAKRHLEGLTDVGKSRAAEYIGRAPDFVQTPLRAALQSSLDFAYQEPSLPETTEPGVATQDSGGNERV